MTQAIEARTTETESWTDLDRAFDAMHRRFAEAFGITPFGWFDGSPATRAPRTDVSDTGTAYRVVVEIPGIPKEKLDIRVRGTSVEIRGEQANETETKDASYLHRERTFASYYRALELPEPVVGTDAKAKVENGVLELELPKQNPTPSPAEVKVAVA